ncbi:hypothetical protein N657DRAFT_451014 [Parathielavia appendiculata]|uniref:Uncharacterized protein n=1 Tax=Parathielavia appendiculata TaxID=2587402 RepID=A0AAN6TYN4_9PEZI|nr:hypothetical protein N657DRAFT_451014 [Parathielavia appendiculata]
MRAMALSGLAAEALRTPNSSGTEYGYMVQYHTSRRPHQRRGTASIARSRHAAIGQSQGLHTVTHMRPSELLPQPTSCLSMSDVYGVVYERSPPSPWPDPARVHIDRIFANAVAVLRSSQLREPFSDAFCPPLETAI